ncbi:hypothetical protein OXPF_39500 [Oxobacter pfennigii]|uniref:Uncharacterized protein n=1 Tax=Oxobacter pfennigii TaxID=36849 RepID=A0A0P8WV97_9CLOT|nr:hypothetical protein [Oxobacter pfennigii]KPU42171.1 hypothetical protein OXPF_39500 [Oxobacter pfennigii]
MPYVFNKPNLPPPVKDKKTCGNPYTDLWVTLKFTLEMSDYCKDIREEDTSPAFHSALCDKCIKKKCRFIYICAELINLKTKEDEDESNTNP